MVATKASETADEPVKRTTKAPAKKAAAKAAPAKRAAKAPAKKAAAKAPAKRGPRKATDSTKPEDGIGTDDATDVDDLAVEPGDDLDVDDADLELDDELEADVSDDDEDDTEDAVADGDAPAEGAKAAPKAAEGDESDGTAELSEKDKASGDFVWDEEESEALRQARKDAELTASADSVRAYLKQIGKVALLNAEEEVELAKRIEAGLYATQLMSELMEKGEKLPAAQRRDMQWICRDGDRAKNHLLEANLRLVVSLA
ncbi:MAG: RNA polymerase sigma factor, partial [Actinobacteria bacterium]|nr:RNA polymerase sigma factor [Actinomycetota bacterium]